MGAAIRTSNRKGCTERVGTGQWDDAKRRSEELNAFLDTLGRAKQGATEGETIGPTALGTFLMAFPPAWMLHRRRMNSFSVDFFFCSLYILSMYSLITDYIFIEVAWKRGYAGNEGLIQNS